MEGMTKVVVFFFFPSGLWYSTRDLEDDILHSRTGVNGAEGG